MHLCLWITRVRGLWVDCRGQDLIEYSLMAGFVAVAVATFFPPAIAPAISVVFSKISVILDQAG